MMDESVRLIVHVSCALVLLETVSRVVFYDPSFWYPGGAAFLVAYVVCIVSGLFKLQDSAFVRSGLFKAALSVMHGLDGLLALLIGLSMLWRNFWGLLAGIMMITKFCQIVLLNRMILANKKVDSAFAEMTQTSKSFLHHVASFLFIQDPTEIILTTAWRTISMFGHSMLVLRGRVAAETLSQMSWVLSYLRNAFVVGMLAACFHSPALQRSFGKSAIGHIAYMTVRLGPVFKLGSIYLNAQEKEQWAGMTDKQRLLTLLSGRHIWLTVELFLLAFTTMYFAYLRWLVLLESSSSWSASCLFTQQDSQEPPCALLTLQGTILEPVIASLWSLRL